METQKPSLIKKVNIEPILALSLQYMKISLPLRVEPTLVRFFLSETKKKERPIVPFVIATSY